MEALSKPVLCSASGPAKVGLRVGASESAFLDPSQIITNGHPRATRARSVWRPSCSHPPDAPEALTTRLANTPVKTTPTTPPTMCTPTTSSASFVVEDVLQSHGDIADETGGRTNDDRSPAQYVPGRRSDGSRPRHGTSGDTQTRWLTVPDPLNDHSGQHAGARAQLRVYEGSDGYRTRAASTARVESEPTEPKNPPPRRTNGTLWGLSIR
jgi:hypothetical protein